MGHGMKIEAIVLPTSEFANKIDLIIQNKKIRRKYSCNIDKYNRLGRISDDQYRAGLRLYADAIMGGVLANMKAIDYMRQPSGGGDSSWQRAEKHKAFGDAMYKSDLGNLERQMLWHVVIFDNDVSSFHANRHFAAELLKETLATLAEYYKSFTKVQEEHNRMRPVGNEISIY